MQQALERAGAGQGQVAALVGEAGVGKSRLVYEFVHSHHTQGWRVLESASVSYGKATPYFPVIDVLRRYGHIEDQDDTRTIRAKVTGQVLTLDEILQDTLPALLSLLDALPEDSPFLKLDPPQRRQRTLDALKRVLLRESQVQPLLLVFEDLHWIDSETQALLESLVESLPTARLLLLVNYRPEYQHGWGSKTYYTQLRLDPLPPMSADEFLQALLGDDASLAPLKPLLIARTEGNPFFLEESVRTLVETGVLVGEPGRLSPGAALPTVQVPATVQAVLAARIDRLPPEDKRLLQTAAVIGTEVPLPLLQAIAEVPEDALHRGLAHLQAAEFLYETRLFPERNTPSSTPSPTRWPTAASSRSGGGCCMRRSSRPWRRSPGTGWPSRSSAWRTMPCGARYGTRPWPTAGRRGRRPWRGQPTARPWGISSRRSVPSRICRSSATLHEQAIDLRLALRTALFPSGDSGRILALSARGRDPRCGPRRSASAGAGLGLSVVHFRNVGPMTRLSPPPNVPLRSPRPAGRSSCTRWRTNGSALPTSPRATIVGRSTVSSRPWSPSTGRSATSASGKSNLPAVQSRGLPRRVPCGTGQVRRGQGPRGRRAADCRDGRRTPAA